MKIYTLVKKYDFNDGFYKCVARKRKWPGYILPNRLNAAQYLEFLNNVLEEQLNVEVSLGERVRIMEHHHILLSQ